MKPSLVTDTLLCLYTTLAPPILCYGNKAWTIRKEDINRITACEMKFMHISTVQI